MGTDYSIEEINRIVKGTSYSAGDSSQNVNELLIDSRRLSHPDKTIFAALVTARNDGHRYIGELYGKGVRNFLVSALPAETERNEMKDATFILVPDTLTALQELAAFHRTRFNIPVIGITGSNGKTIVKEWLSQILGHDKRVVRSPKSFNSQIGVPLSVMEIGNQHEIAILEAGISQPGEMARLEPMIRPTIGIFTTIGHAHDENFLDQRQKIREKLELFRFSKTLLYCRDYENIHAEITASPFLKETKIVTWSRHEPADLVIREIAKNEGHSIIKAVFRRKVIKTEIPFTDDASVENAIHCWLLMLFLKREHDGIASLMKTLSPVEMRLELKEGINNCSLINDSYSLDISSLSIALDFLNQQNQHSRKTVILSDILQSGRDKADLYSEVNSLLVNKGITRIIGIGDEIGKQADQFTIEKQFFSSTGDFLTRFPLSSFRDETILLKGARVFEFEKISSIMQQKVHETVLEINLDAIVYNLNYYRSVLEPGTKIMAMVKAFSYGSGSFEIANILQFHHIDYLAVAYADEGVELRNAGITLPVMVMNPEEQSFGLLLKYGLEAEIYSMRTLEMALNTVRLNERSGHLPMKVHIKLETGMNRLGIMNNELDQLISRLKENSGIKVMSVFSHLAASENPDLDDFTNLQINRFREMSEKISEGLGYQFLRHILNSAGITRFREAHLDMVRLGIGLYGVGFDKNEQGKLKNVSTLKSTVSQIKFVSAEETIGYERAGKLTRGSYIAVVPIGYADGFDRKLGNGKGRMFIHGIPVPTVGNICMDLCMLDITDIVRKGAVTVREGDEVIVFGDEYPLTSLATDLKTIPYEILTGVSRRVKRIYYHE